MNNDKCLIKTNWIVFTGAPSSGKTTLLKFMQNEGKRVIFEVAREIIEYGINHGRTVEEIRSSELEFQEYILSLKIDLEKSLCPNEQIFLDRGLPDSIAYFKMLGINPKYLIKMCFLYRYSKVFLLDPLPMVDDGIRVETEDSIEKLDYLIERAYKKLGYNIIRVPKFSDSFYDSTQQRLDFIHKFIDQG